jgi:hypothetical protein
MAWISIPLKPVEIQPAASTVQKKADESRVHPVAAHGRDMVEFRKNAGPDRREQKAWE